MSDEDRTPDDPVESDGETDEADHNSAEPDDATTASTDASTVDETPLSGLRDRIERRRGRRNGEGRAPTSESGESDDDPFENVEVGEVDREAVWDAVVDGEEPPDPTPAAEAEPVLDDPEGEEHVVDKREFCQRCEHFAAPPDVACAHEGTEIIELVDTDRFRVRDCPKVDAGDDEFGPGLPGE